MNIKTLTQEVQNLTNCKITWELGKKYIALDSETGRVVAEYSPRTGKLLIIK